MFNWLGEFEMGSEHENWSDEEFRKEGWLVFRGGYPDKLCIHPILKQAVFVEDKAGEKEQPSERQKRMFAQYNRLGLGIAIVSSWNIDWTEIRNKAMSLDTDAFIRLCQAEIKRLNINESAVQNIVQEITELRQRNKRLKEENTYLKSHQTRRNKNITGTRRGRRTKGKTTNTGVNATWIIAFQNSELITEMQVRDFMRAEFSGRNSKIFNYPNHVVGKANRGILTGDLIPSPRFKKYPHSI